MQTFNSLSLTGPEAHDIYLNLLLNHSGKRFINVCPSRKDLFFTRSKKAMILTVGIHLARRGTLQCAPPSESDAEIGKNSHLWMGAYLHCRGENSPWRTF